MNAKKLFLSIVLIIVSASFLFGYTLELPENVSSNQSMTVTIIPEAGDPGVESARFYLLQAEGEPLFLDLEESLGIWSGKVPGIYITGGSIQYFAEIKSTDGYIRRIPQKESLTKPLTSDTTPPELVLLSPEDNTLIVGQPQVIMLTAEGEESLTVGEFKVNGQPLEDVISFGPFVKGIYTPADNQKVNLNVSVTDASGNVGQNEFAFDVTGKIRGPFFTAEADWYADAKVTYEVSGDQEGLEFVGDLFSPLVHEVELDFGAGASAELGAGPVKLAVSADLGDTRDMLEYFQSYPSITDYPYISAVISDFYEILRLYNPYAYNYSAGMWTNGRDYESDNAYLLDFSILDEVLVYRFGDQTVSFQDQTVQNMPLRGSFLQLDIPFITVRAGNGLIDLGLSETAWPRQFAGVQVGLDVFDYWYFQTNVSLIADYQGSYTDIRGDAKKDNAIANLYDLVDPEDDTKYLVDPAQNLVLGLGTGINTKWFELKGEAGLTLHASDAGGVTDIEAMVTAFGVDGSTVTPYTGILDTIQGYFPVFDYFPISLGIAYDALDMSLWGLTYGADLTVPLIGLSGWYRKTDGSYKSLGSSITTGMQQVGGLWEVGLGDWGLEVGYNWDTTNIPDILLNDLVPLVETFVTLPTMVSDIFDSLSATSVIPEITHAAEISLSSPGLGYFGRFGLGGSFNWELTDTGGDTSSADYQDAFIIGGSASWKSKTLKFGKFSMGLNAKTDDAFTMNRFVDGVADSSTEWKFGASGGLKMSYDKVGLALGYGRDWGTDTETDTVHQMKATLTFKKVWFDTISIGAGWDESFTNVGVWDEREIDGTLKLKKSFGPFSTGVEVSGGFTDNTDDTEDESEWGAKIWGGISF